MNFPEKGKFIAHSIPQTFDWCIHVYMYTYHTCSLNQVMSNISVMYLKFGHCYTTETLVF